MARVLGVQTIRSLKATNFTVSLAQNAGANENITAPWNFKKAAIVGIRLECTQDLDFDVCFYQGSGFGNADPDLDTYIGKYSFTAANGYLSGEAGINQYYYSAFLSVPMLVEDSSTATTNFVLHCRIINRNASTKSAYPTTSLVLMVDIDSGIR